MAFLERSESAFNDFLGKQTERVKWLCKNLTRGFCMLDKPIIKYFRLT